MCLSTAPGHPSSWSPPGHLTLTLAAHPPSGRAARESRAHGVAPRPALTNAERGAPSAHPQIRALCSGQPGRTFPRLCTIPWGRRETPSRSQKAPGFQWRSSPRTPSLPSLPKDKDMANRNTMNCNRVGRAFHCPSRRHSLIHMSTGLEGPGRVVAWKSSDPVIQIPNCHRNTHTVSLQCPRVRGQTLSLARLRDGKFHRQPPPRSPLLLLPLLPKPLTSWRRTGERGRRVAVSGTQGPL